MFEMNILFINNYYYVRGGSEKVFFDEIEILKKHNHDVTPFSRHYIKNTYSEYQKYFPSNLDYEGVNLLKKIVAAQNLIYSLEAKKKLFELLKSIKPDLIHAHNIYGRLTCSIIDAAKEKKLPVVMTLHDYKLVCPSYLMLCKGVPCERCKGRNYYNCFFRRCHKNNLVGSFIYSIEAYFNLILKKYEWISFFICPSNFSKKKHLEAGIPEEKLIRIPNFIESEKYKPNYEYKDYILYVGRLSKEKGVLTLLRSIKHIDVKLKIVGDGPMRNECERYIEENKITNVEILGYKTGKELEDLYKNSLFVVMPSEWYENAPMVILEAFAYGKPIIASSIGGIPEMVINEKTGLLYSPGDDNDLKDKICYLLNNPHMIKNMGKFARELVEKKYNAELHYKKLISVYKKALER
jgi:glycosyltransferase involved in cell wall biosynthesis